MKKIVVIGAGEPTSIHLAKEHSVNIVESNEETKLSYTPTIQITDPYKDLIEPTILKDGKTLRRERRKANRTTNK
jgi:hypothetical protein